MSQDFLLRKCYQRQTFSILNSEALKTKTKEHVTFTQTKYFKCNTILIRCVVPNIHIGGSGGGASHAPPGPKFLHFHAVFGKNWPNNRLPPPLELAPPLGLVPPLGIES